MVVPTRSAGAPGLGTVVAVLTVGFVGLMIYLGLGDPAVPGLLRGEATAALLVALLAVVAFAAAALGVFATGRVPRRVAYQVVPAAIALVVLVTVVVRTPLTTSDDLVFWLVMIVLLALAAALALAVRRFAAGPDGERDLPGRAVAVVVALLLIGVAAYGVLGLEQRSLLRASYPRIGMANTQDGPNATTTATADATSLPAGGALEMQLFGVPRVGWDTRALCAQKNTAAHAPPCLDASCFYLRNPQQESLCHPLGYMLAEPDQFGVAHAELAVDFPLAEISRIEVVSRICRPQPAVGPADGPPASGAPAGAGPGVLHDTTCAADDDIAGDPPKLAFAGSTFMDP